MPKTPASAAVGTEDLPVPNRQKKILPVVGLGGSAGALPALRDFFGRMPAQNGMAFVVILHLSPDYESNLAAILQHETAMPVMQVRQTVKVEADHVYVIPPNKHLVMNDGEIRLSDIERPRGRRVAVDLFFRTLAESHKSQAISVVLSGTDSDGVIGIKRIKEHGGVTIAQDPDEAEHDGMPRSAIETGMVDWILPVSQMPAKLVEFRANEERIQLPDAEPPAKRDDDENALREVLAFVKARTGHDFAHYKRATILRRIGCRLQVNSLADLPSYLAFLRTHPGESGALLQDLLISVTNFFRDTDAFEALESQIPALLRGKKSGDTVRVWVTGCATGEEAYSIAMLLCEAVSKLESPPTFQIFATDIDETAIQTARDGFYPATIVADVSTERLRRFFVPVQNRYRVKKELREMVLFAAHNLLKDSPFSRLDLITCRNLLIYFNHAAQERTFEVFHFALRPEGLLFIGNSETADEAGVLFVPVDKKHRIFARRNVARAPLPFTVLPTSRKTPPLPEAPILPALPLALPACAPEKIAGTVFSFGELHFQMLEHLAPPSVLVNENYDIVHLSPSAGQFLQFSGGEVSVNLLKVVPPTLRLELRTALFRALQTNGNIEVPRVTTQLDGETVLLDLQVRPMRTGEDKQPYLLVIFAPRDEAVVPTEKPASAEPVARRLEEELGHLKDHLRSTVEQFESSTEELKASNEELLTVNLELKSKVEEVSRSHNDLQNLMASTDIATIFLDRELRIQRYTPRAVDLFQLIPSDLGRPLSDLRHKMLADDLVADAERVIDHLAPIEHEIATTDGLWFLLRILPYRTTENKIDGVVLTFVDITRRKIAEDEVRQNEEKFRLLVEGVEDYAIFSVDLEGVITSWNSGVERIFGFSEAAFVGLKGEVIFTPEDRAEKRPERELELAARTGHANDERWHVRKDGSCFWASGVMTALRNNKGELLGFSKILRDNTERREAELELRAAHDELENRVAARTTELVEANDSLNIERQRLEEVLQRMPAGVIMAEAPGGQIALLNQAARELLALETDAAPLSEWKPLDAAGKAFSARRKPLTRVLKRGETISGEEMSIRRADGVLVPLSVNAAPIRNAENKIVAAIVAFLDITERKRIEAIRQQLMQRLVTAQEEERHRISRELHDQMGQQLTALLMGLKALPDSHQLGEDYTKRLTNLRALTTEIMEQVHRLAWELRPAALDTLGLEAALEQYVKDWSQDTVIAADFVSRGLEGTARLSAPMETALYRIAQEALTNIQRHAEATIVSLVLERRDGEIVLIVEDNGQGFDGKARARKGWRASSRLGLLGMQERAELVGGTLTIESAPKQGTTVYTRVPV